MGMRVGLLVGPLKGAGVGRPNGAGVGGTGFGFFVGLGCFGECT